LILLFFSLLKEILLASLDLIDLKIPIWYFMSVHRQFAIKALAKKINGFSERRFASAAGVSRVGLRNLMDHHLLVSFLQLKKPSDVFDIIAHYYPNNRIEAKPQFFIEELFENRKES
jgi:hypothetical protein